MTRGRRTLLPNVQRSEKAAESLIEALEASDRFRRDGPIGRIFHPRKISYREIAPTNSLHVLVGGDASRRTSTMSAPYAAIPTARPATPGSRSSATTSPG